MAASVELLSALHEAVGTLLLERIKSGEATAAEIGQAIRFLKDNGIEAMPDGNDMIASLAEAVNSLPFSDPDDPTIQ